MASSLVARSDRPFAERAKLVHLQAFVPPPVVSVLSTRRLAPWASLQLAERKLWVGGSHTRRALRAFVVQKSEAARFSALLPAVPSESYWRPKADVGRHSYHTGRYILILMAFVSTR